MIISAAYISNLTAVLTITKRSVEFETVHQLCETNLHVGSMGDFFKGELASAVDPYLKVLWNKSIMTSRSLSAHVRSVRDNFWNTVSFTSLNCFIIHQMIQIYYVFFIDPFFSQTTQLNIMGVSPEYFVRIENKI